MSSKIQSLENLTLHLLQGTASLEPLRVLDMRSMVWCGWGVTLMVLGTSHALHFQKGTQHWMEILTCVAPKRSENLILEAQGGETGSYEQELCGLRWNITLTPFELRGSDTLEGVFEETLTATYPSTTTQSPLTQIGWQRDQTLIVETLHTYPEEGRGVRTVTQVEVLPNR
jgi:hypothetical protein